MSEFRSATLTPFGKSEKKSNKSPRKTYRFSFALSDPSEDSCSVFDYGSVVKLEERKLIKKRREESRENKANGGFKPFNDDEDNDDDVRRLARKFEEKYGEKKSRSKSYAELGAGYDETDPFIDNTEACDEEMEEDQETPCGGYYVNSGPLELKKVDVSDQSDADDAGKRRHKRVLSDVEEEDEEEQNVEEGEAEEEEEDGVSNNKIVPEEKPETEEIVPETKKNNLEEKEVEPEEKFSQIPDGLERPVKNKRKHLTSEDLDSGTAVVKPKKIKTVKALLEEKRVHDVQPAEEPKKQTASLTSINEAIESVINAGHHDENSNGSSTSKSGTSTSEDSNDGKPNSENLPPPLPPNLSPEVMTLVENIRRIAAVTENTRKTFCPDINANLSKVEWKSREFSATNRNLLFAHLAFYLPCTKDTLMRRAKKLFILKEENQLETIICKLKATIDATMPSLLENYEKERQRIIEEKGIGASASNGTNPGDNHQTPESVSPKLPKRKFPWSQEIRGYLKDIIKLKKRCYRVLKPRKSSCEEYIVNFISSRVRVLWPQGWMKSSTLLRECNLMSPSGKLRHSSENPNKSDSPRLNASYPSPSANNSIVTDTPSVEQPAPQQPPPQQPPPQQPAQSPSAADPLDLLAQITTAISASQPGHHQNIKSEKPESFSMDCLLKRTKENTNCHDFTTTLSDLMKDGGVIMNGASLPSNNVNISQSDVSSRSEKVLDLSSCNSSVNGTPSGSVVQTPMCSNERTAMRASDSVSLNVNTPVTHPPPSPFKKENSSTEGKHVTKDLERRMSEETTTATDILSQIISESLLAPSSLSEEKKRDTTPVTKGQELLFDVMQDLKELNHMSSKQDYKKNSYTGVSWSQPPSNPADKSVTSAYHKEFLKHVFLAQENPAHTPPSPSPYSRHSVSPYENSPYMNDTSSSVALSAYNSTPHRAAQSISSHAGSASGKMTQLSQSCGMVPHTNTVPSGHSPRYPMDYPSNDQHVLGLPSAVQFNWFPGSESQPHQ